MTVYELNIVYDFLIEVGIHDPSQRKELIQKLVISFTDVALKAAHEHYNTRLDALDENSRQVMNMRIAGFADGYRYAKNQESAQNKSVG